MNCDPSTGSNSSYAPMSQRLPCGRGMSRWSVPEHPVTDFGMASTAGLVIDSANVSVLPPLNASPPPLKNCGLVLWMSPVDVKPQSVAVSRL